MIRGRQEIHLPWRAAACCPLCDNPAAMPGLCPGCLADLPWNRSACRRCALPLPDGQDLCADCGRRPPLQLRTLAPLRYEFPADHLVTGLKYRRRLDHARLLGRLLCDAVLADGSAPRPELILPMPLHAGRLAERGYNQALEIARPLARALALPLETRLLRRDKAAPPQMSLDAEARLGNLRQAFALDAKQLARLGRISRIALVDDVMTTGTTLAEAAHPLQQAGIAHIEFWVVARTP